jgi:hypothetical protein
VAIVAVVIVLLLGGDPGTVLQQDPLTPSTISSGASGTGTPQDEAAQFVSVVLASTEDVWTEQFRLMGETYRPPRLVLYSGTVQTPAGFASAASGPFYSPADQKVYLDTSFFRELKTRFGAPGDFAEAYVIAHEVGHHVQKLLGIMEQVDAAQARASEARRNELSVRLELQADFLAGLWAHYAQAGLLEAGDIDEGLAAAAAIGDDRLQMQAQGYVVPDAFTHGTSDQRMRWFKLGYQTGDISRADTFAADPL